jgi:hypothetical protein
MTLRRSLILATVLSLLCASTATAATRYASPDGTGADPCANPTKPCSLFTAAAENTRGSSIKAGDVVELAPGTYRPYTEREVFIVWIPEGVTVRGAPGKPKPVIVIPKDSVGYGAFLVQDGAELADVEVRNHADPGSAIDISGGTITRVIARSTHSSEATCNFFYGEIRSSACINSGGGIAVGASVAGKGEHTGAIRNSTLVATGPGAVGMSIAMQAFKRGMSTSIDLSGAVVRGEETDLVARAGALNRGRGAKVSIDLRESNYATIETEATDGGSASVTRPGTNANTTALPLFAAGNLHQLPDSPALGVGIDGLGPGPTANPIPNTVLDDELPWARAPKGMTAKIEFGSSELGSHFQCKFDRGRFRACSSPFERTPEEGAHAFRVRAIDPEGQVDPTPAVVRWRVLPLRAFGYDGDDD